MTDLTPEQLQDLRRAFDLTQDSGVVDQYGAKKMLQIFNMNPTTEDVTKRYLDNDKDASAGMAFDEFERVFHDYLINYKKVPDTLNQTLADLFDGPISKPELRKILTEMGSEPFEPEEADEVLNEIQFDENGLVHQEVLKEFLMNKVDMRLPVQKADDQEGGQEKADAAPSPEAEPPVLNGDGKF
ncbi:CATR-like protein [Mya arenaria]|uniref:CATR-like protein n=1 Tax=Mya arenaria TaxID=6604 RepID=A0ABY7F243_MYAAR|nr:troponin C, slow skeletal and cardiac muscles-like [Mya arenaria]WAR16235.1 CATR-like protein [Mya arenaria]